MVISLFIMKNLFILISFLLAPLFLSAQFEQKIGIDLSVGGFKTVGATGTDDMPMQMPNYKPGFSANGGLQFKISKHFSLTAEGGIMFSKRWAYKGEDFVNDLTWVINDTITGALLAEGEDYLDIFNYSFGLRFKYYFLPEKKFDPYIFAGVNVNRTRSFFDNTEWAAYKKLGWLAADDTIPGNDNLEQSFGFGINPGLGVEYSPNDKLHFYLESGYYLISLDKKSFTDALREENFHAIRLQVGVRLNFIKSKEL
jgi:opacity protein-like surface antigen